MNEPRVIIAVLNYRGGTDIMDCIESILKMDYSNYELIIVDNNSPDNSACDIKNRYGNKLTLILNESNLGTAGGYNVCIKEASEREAKYIYLLNNDVILEKRCLKELVKIAETVNNVGSVGPKVYFLEEPKSIWSYGGRVSWNRCKTNHVKSPLQGKFYDVDYIPGCAILIPIEIFKRVGMFDEDYFMYWEDVDFGIRIKKSGYRNIAVAGAVVFHKVGARKGEYNKITTYYPIRNKLLFAREYLKGFRKLSFYCYSIIFLFQKLSAVILGGIIKKRADSLVRISALFRAYLDFILGKFGKRI